MEQRKVTKLRVHTCLQMFDSLSLSALFNIVNKITATWCFLNKIFQMPLLQLDPKQDPESFENGPALQQCCKM